MTSATRQRTRCSREFRAGLALAMRSAHGGTEQDFQAARILDKLGRGTGEFDRRTVAPFPARAGIDRPQDRSTIPRESGKNHEPPRVQRRRGDSSLGGLGSSLHSVVVCLLVLYRRDLTDGPHEVVVVGPPDPFEGGELDDLDAVPGAPPPYHFRLEEAGNDLGQGHCRNHPLGFLRRAGCAHPGQSLRVNAEVLPPAVAVVEIALLAVLPLASPALGGKDKAGSHPMPETIHRARTLPHAPRGPGHLGYSHLMSMGTSRGRSFRQLRWATFRSILHGFGRPRDGSSHLPSSSMGDGYGVPPRPGRVGLQPERTTRSYFKLSRGDLL